MARRMRCKFRVMSTTRHHHGQVDLRAMPVYEGTPGDKAEHKAFWEATPSGELTLSLSAGTPATELALNGGLAPGNLFYMDITPVEGEDE